MKNIYNRCIKQVTNMDLCMRIFCASVALYLSVAIPILMGGI